ncbi:Arylsulfotransferase-domain-containing protein [Xylariaceae sp. FL0804]|nr:Arylsulfotransferase-domain-containing protein [Xylariaceae sp. FL0804]
MMMASSSSSSWSLRHSLRFSSLFTAACLVVGTLADLPLITDAAAFNAGAFGDRPNQTYYTHNFKSPRFLVNSWDRNASRVGTHFFMSPGVPEQGPSPMIFDAEDLSLVYLDTKWGGNTDTRMQMFDGTPYMTFFSGYDFKGHGTGGGVMVDQNYNQFKNLTTTNLGAGADSHDFHFTHDGGAIMNNYHTIIHDVTSVGGPPNGHVLTCAFQEVDIATGEVRFTWQSHEHFDIAESWADAWMDIVGGWDWFHMNAISKTVKGNYLISSRHLRMVALISGKDGSRIWQVGGRRNSFKDLSGGRATDFRFQHDARFTDETETEITLFDNHNMHASSPTPGCTHECTRALRIRIDTDAMTAEVVSEWYHPVGVQAWAQGGYQLQENGNALIGWGVVPAFTEYDPQGNIIMDIQGRPWSSTENGGMPFYRVYRLNWEGRPTWRPTVAAVDGVIYVSWNGATEVRSWALSGGDSHISLQSIDTFAKAGFETAFTPSRMTSFVQIDALDASGDVIGSSHVFDTVSGESVFTIIRE